MLMAVLALMQAGCAVVAQPATGVEIAAFAGDLAARVDDPGEALPLEIDIHDAIARAIKHNADLRVKELEVAVEDARLGVANAGMLPDIVTNSTYYKRRGSDATYSSLSPSAGASSDLALSWNILDFGLSYVRARQGGDTALYRAEEHRRAAAKVVEETRLAFWRAVAAERLISRLPGVQKNIAEALAMADVQAKDQRLETLDALNYSRDLLNEKRELNDLISSLAGATPALKQLINVPQHQALSLKAVEQDMPVELLAMEPQQAVQIALENRAEVRQLLYQTRITADEVNAVVLQALPSLGVNGGLAAGGLSVLADGNWVAVGVKAAWSLMSLLRLPRDLAVVDAEKELLRQKALVTGVTVSMQVYVANTQCKLLNAVYQDAVKSVSVQRKIEHQVKLATNIGRNGKQPWVREHVSSLLSETRAALAYAELQNAFGTYQSTLGRDVVDLKDVQDLSAAEIAERFRNASGGEQLSWQPLSWEPKKVVSLQ
jgi:outer membrane protein TolC